MPSVLQKLDVQATGEANQDAPLCWPLEDCSRLLWLLAAGWLCTAERHADTPPSAGE